MAETLMDGSTTEGIETIEATENNNSSISAMKERKVSWAKLRRVDSLNMEAGRVSFTPNHGSKVNWTRTLSLAFQSIGVIYGDIGTSPLYVYASTFPNEIHNLDDILGVLSLIIYTLILVPMLKYVFIVLRANDNGDGGTFALYSLICRYAKVSLVPNQQPEDRELSNYRLDTPSIQLRRAQKIKEKLENSVTAKVVLFLVTILGTSMVIGDGVLTPCISVLSAVSGIKSLSKDAVVGVSIAILIVLFSVQRFGTDKVGYSFAPVIVLWFTFISGIGLYNLFKHDVGVLRAFNPKYMIDYFKRNGKKGWISLGGVVLCITGEKVVHFVSDFSCFLLVVDIIVLDLHETGTEAMFADLGHFNVRAVQVNPLYWPTFVIAISAAVIASQAMISGAFAIISQSLSLGCFPRVKVVHTSAEYEGQVYIPEINYMLMVACVIVTFGFKTTEKIGNAYGIAVVAVMVITTCMVTLIMLVIWKTSIWWIALFFAVFASIEVVYLSSVLYKFKQGGFLPLAFSLVLMTVMGIWHYVHKQRYMFELNNKVSSDYLTKLGSNPDINRVPGIGLLYSELVEGIPPIFPHFIDNIPSIHSVLVLVSIKSILVSKVALEERFLFRQVEPRDYRVFRCVVRYGYNDKVEEPKEFERQLVDNLKEFIRHEHFIVAAGATEETAADPAVDVQHSAVPRKDAKLTGSSSSMVHVEESGQQKTPDRVSSSSIHSFSGAYKSKNSSSGGIIAGPIQGAEEEMQFLQTAMDRGVVYLLGEAEVVAKPNSSLLKKAVVDYAYGFLRKNFREGEKVMAIPHTRLLRVGMTYEI
ncbi:hypothetical protein RJ640_011746 [Escallonia rubra]|uniref:Potassium transporter n=1 Tax=Escallonia rubra TaxID=112253 RepID=A0AA88QPI8_9ASTE|nr:hypothetical protein RJ640_011746 [Escallonia rubra]